MTKRSPFVGAELSDRITEADHRYAEHMRKAPRKVAKIQEEIRLNAAAEEAKLTPAQRAVRDRHRARVRDARVALLDRAIDELQLKRDRVIERFGA